MVPRWHRLRDPQWVTHSWTESWPSMTTGWSGAPCQPESTLSIFPHKQPTEAAMDNTIRMWDAVTGRALIGPGFAMALLLMVFVDGLAPNAWLKQLKNHLVGALVAINFVFSHSYIGLLIIPIDVHIFQRYIGLLSSSPLTFILFRGVAFKPPTSHVLLK